jgi:hypothetical protein
MEHVQRKMEAMCWGRRVGLLGKHPQHSYDILGAGMLWKPKEARKYVKIHVEECFGKVLNEEF